MPLMQVFCALAFWIAPLNFANSPEGTPSPTPESFNQEGTEAKSQTEIPRGGTKKPRKTLKKQKSTLEKSKPAQEKPVEDEVPAAPALY